ncbi:proline-rich 33 kDa extensin-related protein-like [Durio zibethinus]|uniref:Proline-rich 33 kDa extensin-related protein-like n=1 Tax=Durio zibethinus TaxID=66656 RepID=A0A6P5X2X7_DURZI|nr:proline-rich 33 kDa extensin-related protein-like [Durio zibethinus]
MQFKTSLLVLLLFGVLVFTTPSFADHHKPPHKPPVEETSVEPNSQTLDANLQTHKPPGGKPPHKPPSSQTVGANLQKHKPPGGKPPHKPPNLP